MNINLCIFRTEFLVKIKYFLNKTRSSKDFDLEFSVDETDHMSSKGMTVELFYHVLYWLYLLLDHI